MMASLTADFCSETNHIKQILSEFTRGEIGADECFCLILSLNGYELTRSTFLTHIDSLKLTAPRKFTELLRVYREYFSQCPDTNFTDPIECSVENGYITSDFGYELDMELALSKSLTESLSLSPFTSQSYATCVKSRQPMVLERVTENVQQESSSTEGASKRTENTPTCTLNNPISDIPGLALSDNTNFKSRKKKKGKKMPSLPGNIASKPVIYWIRRDLRIHDNPALVAAAASNVPVIMVFLWSEMEEDPNNDVAAGGATKLWLHYALKSFNASLVEKYGNGIVFRKTSDCASEIKQICEESGATTLTMNDLYEPFLKLRDDKICDSLRKKGITCKRFHSYLLYEPGSVSTEDLGMRGIGSVTHFMECCRRSSTQPIGQTVDAPGVVPKPHKIPTSAQLDELELAKMPRRKDGTLVFYNHLLSTSNASVHVHVFFKYSWSKIPEIKGVSCI